jgi:cell surface protein SprA
MPFRNIFHPKIQRAVRLLPVLACLCAFPVWAQVGLRLPEPEPPVAPVTNPARKPASPLALPLSRTPVSTPASVQHVIQIDSTNQTVLIREVLSDHDFALPRRMPLNDYLRERSRVELEREWLAFKIQKVTTASESGNGRQGITIATPKIKSEAFRRVFGGETLSLNVTGNITINGEMRNEKRSQTKTAADRAPNTSFQMKQTQNFKVTGKIGENVSVDVDQDSERMFEFENAIHLKYSSEEDGIIQSIEAGNVALSLPGTRFVTFSAQNAGLFGIKSQMKIGALDLTAIASMEKGEKKKLSLTGGKEEGVQKIYDYDYKRNTYFYLNDFYRMNMSRIDSATGSYYLPPADSAVTEIEVYKSDANYQNKLGEGAFRAWALLDPEHPDTSKTDQMHYRGYFMRVQPSDYTIMKKLGFVILDTPLQESEALAVAYRTASGREYGQVTFDSTSKNMMLKLVKPRSPRPSDPTWNLEWKNVYSIGNRGMEKEGFQLAIYQDVSSGEPKQAYAFPDGSKKGFLEIFGLDLVDKNERPVPDNLIDDRSNFLNFSSGELIFPDQRPFGPGSGSQFQLPDALRSDALYDTTSQDYIRNQSKFYIEVKSTSRSANYSLGMNVIENSEEVICNGQKLVKGQDYDIEYTSGSLTLLGDKGRDPNDKLEINYESQQMISVEKKSLIGLRAEYSFREDAAQKSFIGATLLYMNQKTMDQRIRLGQDGPMKNLVWDVNTALNFQPNFMTKVLDALPLIDATSPSALTFEGEIAQVIPDPNTLNNPSTGDKDGVAYLDDFEGSKREIPLGVIYSGWGPGSLPDPDGEVKDQLRRRGHLIWYNPYEQVDITDIWPNREVTTNYGGSTKTHVLDLIFQPNPGSDSSEATRETSWGGIERYLSSGYADQTNSRFLEIWLHGNQGTLHVDLGQISEDVIPNSRLDDEDLPHDGLQKNDLLDDNEDRGLDLVYGEDAPTPFAPHQAAVINTDNPDKPVATPYDFWDVDGDKVKDDWEPWSSDNWHYEPMEFDYTRINGTENSKASSQAIYPNSEDLNSNGDVDLNNDYYEFSFNLEEGSAGDSLVSGGNPDRNNARAWRQYRIPLNRPDAVVGQPQWSRIEYIRLWIDGVRDAETKVRIAEINLVGNEWKYQGTKTREDAPTFDTSKDSVIAIEVINTHDNPDYTEPPGVRGVVDPIQKIRSKEQSLRLKVNQLPSGTSAFIQRQFYEAEDLIHYKTLKMFLHGGGVLNDLKAEDSLYVFLRLGSDTNNRSYYEIRVPMRPGWDPLNEVDLDFEVLSNLKIAARLNPLDSTVVLENGQRVTLAGSPSLRNIRWLTVGVRNAGVESFTGEFWLDELRLSNVRKDKGIAMRVRSDFRWSDFFSINGEYNRKDADFHTINERFSEGSNTRSGNLNASLQLQKFFPASWGLSLPVNTTYSKSVSDPKYCPDDTDILLKSVTSDSIKKAFQDRNEQKGISFSLAKSSKSRNWFSRLLLDPMSGGANFSRGDRHSYKTPKASSEQKGGSFRYRIAPSGDNTLLPFAWVGKKGFLKKISQIKFTYVPSDVNFDMNGSYSRSNSESLEGIATNDTTATLTRNFDTTYQPFQAVTLDFARASTSDMRYADWTNELLLPTDSTTTDKSQNFGIKLNPKLSQWLTPNASYSANYRWRNNLQQRANGTGISASIANTLTLSGTFDASKLVASFQKKKTGSKPSPVRRPAPAAPNAGKPGETAKPQDAKKDNRNGFSVLSIFPRAAGIFKKIDPISVNFSKTESRNDLGILDTPDLNYMLGFDMSPDNLDHSLNVSSNAVSMTRNIRWSLRTGVKITTNLTASVDYNFSDNLNRSSQSTQAVTRTAYVSGEHGMPFPTWNLQWRGLEKTKFISKYLKTLSFSHSFSGQQDDNYTESKLTSTKLSKNYRPFMGIAVGMKNGITGNIQYNNTSTITTTKTGTSSGARKKQMSSSVSVSGSYSKKGGIRLPFMKNKKLDNNLDFKLSFESTSGADYSAQSLTSRYTNTRNVKSWTLEPRVDYSFSTSVNGGCYLKLGQSKNLQLGTTKTTAFGINCVISLAGR